MFIPCGVETIITFVDLPDDIVGYTELKNCSATLAGTYANSSRKIILNELPRTVEADVEAASILLPFSNSRLPLFHDITPCCNHLGKFSYASCNLPNKSLEVAALLASIAMFVFGLNNA